MAAEKGRPYAGVFHDDYHGARSLIPDPEARCRLYEAVFEYSIDQEQKLEETALTAEGPAFAYLYQTMIHKIDYQEAVYKKKVEGGRKGGQSKAQKEKEAEDWTKQLETVRRGALQVGWKDAPADAWTAVEKALKKRYTPARVLDAMRAVYEQTQRGHVKDWGAYMLKILENDNKSA